jgi:hypothetical protein
MVAPLRSSTRTDLRNGIGMKLLNPRPSPMAASALSRWTGRPHGTPKKSTAGALTLGSVAPS